MVGDWANPTPPIPRMMYCELPGPVVAKAKPGTESATREVLRVEAAKQVGGKDGDACRHVLKRLRAFQRGYGDVAGFSRSNARRIGGCSVGLRNVRRVILSGRWYGEQEAGQVRPCQQVGSDHE